MFVFLAACSAPLPVIPIDSQSVEPGTQVMRGSDTLNLLGTPLKVGDTLPSVRLFNQNLQLRDISQMQGEVLLISVVPSLDTQVCERQTRMLADFATDLPANVRRVTISRDLPFAQKRFSDELPQKDGIYYLSDYAAADFGRSTGLLVDRIHLLARAVIVADQQGIVRYLQVVPSITHLPDLQQGVEFAAQLAAGKQEIIMQLRPN
jgi:thiol peroxidase